VIYFLIFLFLIFLRYSLGGHTRLREQLYMPLLILLFVFSAFRFEVGCDWFGYLNQYNVYAQLTFFEGLGVHEPLWVALFSIQHFLDLPYPWINVFSSAVFFYGVHVLARRQPDAFAFLILIFPILIINMPMTAMRQAAGIGIICMAFAAFIDRSTFRFVVLTIVAAMFHSSAIILLLIAPMVAGKYSKSRLFLSVILAIPGGLILLSTQAAESASGQYIGSGVDSAGALFRVGLLALSGLFFFLFLKKKWESAFPKDYKLVVLGALMMIAMLFLVPVSSVISDRLGYYLIPIQAMIFARIPFLPIQRNRAVYAALPYLGLMAVFLVWTSISWHFQLCYLPYKTWIFGFPDATTFQF